MEKVKKLEGFLKNNPTAFHIAEAQAKELAAAGYTEVFEADRWNLKRGGKYFVRRNGSCIAAFEIPAKKGGKGMSAAEDEKTPSKANPEGFAIMASHSDYPLLKIKENPEMERPGCTTLNVECYGGGLWYSWLDRPLSVAGRLVVEDGGSLKTVLVNIDRNLLMIPSLAIHMNREADKKLEINAQRDLIPVLGLEKSSLMPVAAEAAGVDPDKIIASELFVYSRTEPTVWGANNEFFAAPHLDDASCAFCSLEGFLGRKKGGKAIPLHIVFDNEEVGSSTKQGAASTFLKDITVRINAALGGDEEELQQRIAKSFMLSADNSHAVHPNYTEKCDPTNRPVMGGGVVLKFSGNQKYSTDAESAAVCRSLANKAGIKLQTFHNRSDMPGGSTLGNISGNQVPVRTADIGMAQLAMHSSYECMGCGDIKDMISLASELFSM